MTSPSQEESQLDALVAEAWDALLERDPYTATTAGRRVTGFGRGDLTEAETAVANARARRDRPDRIDLSTLGQAHRRLWPPLVAAASFR